MEPQIILASSILHETQGREALLYFKNLHSPFSPRDPHKTGDVMGKKTDTITISRWILLSRISIL